MKESNIKNGKLMFEQALKNAGYSVSKLTEKKYMQTLLDSYNLNSVDELYSAVGHGSYHVKIVSNKLISIYTADTKKQQEHYHASNIEHIKIHNMDGKDKKIDVNGVGNLMIKFAKCCVPLEGDEIVGFLSVGRGIIIHRKQCANVPYFNPERLIKVSWKKD